MNKYLKTTLVILFSVLAFAIILYFIYRSGNIPENSSDLEGNTTGNINNGGYFCQLDDTVYFANAYDQGCLYKMNADGSNMEKLSDAIVKYINAAGKYVYYYQENSAGTKTLGFVQQYYGIYRIRDNGNDPFCLHKAPIGIMKLVGNYIYYQYYDTSTGIALHKISLDKKEETTIADYEINPSSYGNGSLYFTGSENDLFLYAVNLSDDRIDRIWDEKVWNPTYVNGYIYYMNMADDYKLCRYSLIDQSIETLTSDRLDTFNIYENIIYYQKNSQTEPALKRMNLDGSNPEIVAEGNFDHLSITSAYVYFSEFGNSIPVYKTPTFGTINVQTFDEAIAAIPVSD